MKYILIFSFCLSYCFSKSNGISLGKHHWEKDTVYFAHYRGVVLDTLYLVDFERFRLMKRFKADTSDVLIMERNIPIQSVIAFETKVTFLEDSLKNEKTEMAKTILKKFSKKKIVDGFKKELNENYTNYDRKYFGYYDENGDKQILIKYFAKEIPPDKSLAEIQTLPLMSYNIKTGKVLFPEN